MKTDRMTLLVCGWMLVGALPGWAAENREITVAAYYFPNWHVDPEKGRTTNEWGSLQRAKPRFEGHAQPKVPLWGYENEADPKAMERKIDAAADHGVDAFIFDYYYNDRLHYFLESALEKGFLKARNNDRIKFAIMWANHDLFAIGDFDPQTFTAPEKGEQQKPQLIPGAVNRQTFDMLVEHMVKTYMTHPSYWKIDGKPYFSIYELKTLIKGLGGVEQTAEALDHFRQKVREAGLPGLHLNVVDWQLKQLDDVPGLLGKLGVDSVTSYVWIHWIALKDFPKTEYDYVFHKYLDYWEKTASGFGVPYFPHAQMGWDSTPRMPADQPHDNRGYPNTAVMVGNTPEAFRQAMATIKERMLKHASGPRVITLNAWNEWTEGSYLEPDTVNGMGYLEAIRSVFGKAAQAGDCRRSTK